MDHRLKQRLDDWEEMHSTKNQRGLAMPPSPPRERSSEFTYTYYSPEVSLYDKKV
jgi:hypothetical protein